jgi:exopolysaccharide production protein ExoQ
VLVSLITVSLAESSVLVTSGWFLLVVCGIKVAENLSWRTALPE